MTQERAIKLGKQLVETLGLEPGVDTLSKWMAHYVAEQIATAENATRNKKAAAQERCFQTVLSLWKHRATFPPSRRPLESFEPILRALHRLDPENPQSYYHHLDVPKDKNIKTEPESTQASVDFIFKIDNAARVLIELALEEATQTATTKEIKALLKTVLPNRKEGDVVAISTLLNHVELAQPNTKKLKLEARRRFQQRIQMLNAFSSLCAKVTTFYKMRLKAIK